MNPNETLRQLRGRAADLTHLIDVIGVENVDDTDGHYLAVAAMAREAVDLFRGLDDSLTRGCFLPAAWERPFGSAQSRNRDRAGGTS